VRAHAGFRVTVGAGDEVRDGKLDLNVYAERRAWMTKARLALVGHFLAPRHRILDVGCGGGLMLAALRDAGHEVMGVEPDPISKEACNRQGLPCVLGAFPEAADDLQRCDAVMSWHSLEHSADPAAFMASMVSAAVPGGLLVVEVPVERKLGGSMGHAQEFSRESARGLFGKYVSKVHMDHEGVQKPALLLVGRRA